MVSSKFTPIAMMAMSSTYPIMSSARGLFDISSRSALYRMYSSIESGSPCPIPFVTIIVSDMKSLNCNLVLPLVSSS